VLRALPKSSIDLKSPSSILSKDSSGICISVFIGIKKGGIKPPFNYISIIRIYI
jgi:hypothetical protein